ncbi:hypothetical protein ACQY0O_001611 [Thecaphora frezii]
MTGEGHTPATLDDSRVAAPSRASNVTAADSTGLLSLPSEVLDLIASHVTNDGDIASFTSLAQVCHAFRRAFLRQSPLWRLVRLRNGERLVQLRDMMRFYHSPEGGRSQLVCPLAWTKQLQLPGHIDDTDLVGLFEDHRCLVIEELILIECALSPSAALCAAVCPTLRALTIHWARAGYCETNLDALTHLESFRCLDFVLEDGEDKLPQSPRWLHHAILVRRQRDSPIPKWEELLTEATVSEYAIDDGPVSTDGQGRNLDYDLPRRVSDGLKFLSLAFFKGNAESFQAVLFRQTQPTSLGCFDNLEALEIDPIVFVDGAFPLALLSCRRTLRDLRLNFFVQRGCGGSDCPYHRAIAEGETKPFGRARFFGCQRYALRVLFQQLRGGRMEALENLNADFSYSYSKDVPDSFFHFVEECPRLTGTGMINRIDTYFELGSPCWV